MNNFYIYVQRYFCSYFKETTYRHIRYNRTVAYDNFFNIQGNKLALLFFADAYVTRVDDLLSVRH